MEEKNVLVLNEKTEDAAELEKAYANANDINYKVTSVFEANHAVEALKDSPQDLLVFNLSDFSKKKLNAVTDLRKLGVDFPLLTIADNYDEEAYRFVKNLEDSVLLNKPYKKEQLLSLSKKMSTGQFVAQRQFPRFETGEKAYVSLYPNGEPSQVEVKDLSKGGACIVAPIGVGLKQGDVVKFRMYLENVGRNHHFSGRVIWMDLISDEGSYYMGLKFMSDSEIFKSLLFLP